MIEKRIIKIEGTDKKFSALDGVFVYDQLIKNLLWQSKLIDMLPKNKIEPSTSTAFDKFKAFCLAFVAGSDCLDDMEKLECDTGFREILGYVNAPITYGDYLRDFSLLQIRNFRHKLIECALELRIKAFSKEKDFILDLDSTSCRQHGKKMEGVEYNYNGDWCLDSIQAYDQFGLQYYIDVRPGGTYSSNNAVTITHEVRREVDRLVREIQREFSYGFS